MWGNCLRRINLPTVVQPEDSRIKIQSQELSKHQMKFLPLLEKKRKPNQFHNCFSLCHLISIDYFIQVWEGGERKREKWECVFPLSQVFICMKWISKDKAMCFQVSTWKENFLSPHTILSGWFGHRNHSAWLFLLQAKENTSKSQIAGCRVEELRRVTGGY